MTAVLLYVFAFAAVLVGSFVLAVKVAVRPARAHRPAPEDSDLDTAATLDELLRIAEARAPAAATLTALERRLYHG